MAELVECSTWNRRVKFETHRRHCAVSLTKLLYSLLSTGSTQEDRKASRHDLKFVDWDEKHQHTETKHPRALHNGVARTLKKLRTSKGDYWIKQWIASIAPLFKMGTSLTGKNLLLEGANSFLFKSSSL